MVLPVIGGLDGQTNQSFNYDDDDDTAGKSSYSTRRNSHHTAQTPFQASKVWKKSINAARLSTGASTDRQRHVKLQLLERYLSKHDNSAALKLAIESLHKHPLEFPVRVDQDRPIEPKKKRGCSAVLQYMAYLNKKLGLSHILLLLLLIGYALAGGAIFEALEQPQEIEDLHSMQEALVQRIGNVSNEVIAIVFSNANDTDRQTAVELIVKGFYKDMLDLEGRIKNSVFYKIDTGQLVWHFSSAVFYACTLFTTIGYGTIACATAWGRAISVIYATIGIPLMLFVLNDLGRVLFFALQKLYNRIYQLCRRTRLCRNVDEEDDEDGTVEHAFPLRIAVPLVFVYLLICAVIIEGFDYALDRDTSSISFGDSFYFAFISLSTIGLGDVMPNNIQYSPFLGGMFLFGLALLSVINSTIYVQMERNYFRAMEAMEEVLEELHAEEMDAEIRGHKVFGGMSDALRIAALNLPGIDEQDKSASTNNLGNLGRMPGSLRKSTSSRHSVSFLQHRPHRQSTNSNNFRMPTLGVFGCNLSVLREMREMQELQELAKSSLKNSRKKSCSDTNLFFIRPRRLSLLSF